MTVVLGKIGGGTMMTPVDMGGFAEDDGGGGGGGGTLVDIGGGGGTPVDIGGGGGGDFDGVGHPCLQDVITMVLVVRVVLTEEPELIVTGCFVLFQSAKCSLTLPKDCSTLEHTHVVVVV